MISYSVTTSSSKGTIIRIIRDPNICFRPGKRSLEKAKAARMVVTAVRATMDTVTTMELTKYRRKGADLKTLTKLSGRKEEGIHTGGLA